MKVKVALSCPTLCNPMGCILCPWITPGKNTRVSCHSLLQRIFPIQWSNPGLLCCRQILYSLRYQGSPEPSRLAFKAYIFKSPNLLLFWSLSLQLLCPAVHRTPPFGWTVLDLNSYYYIISLQKQHLVSIFVLPLLNNNKNKNNYSKHLLKANWASHYPSFLF